MWIFLHEIDILQDACLAAKQSGRKAAEFVISRCPGIFPLRKPNPVSFGINYYNLSFHTLLSFYCLSFCKLEKKKTYAKSKSCIR